MSNQQEQQSRTMCESCGAPIEQNYGARTRRFCKKPYCRKKASDAGIKQRALDAQERTQRQLYQDWQQLLPGSRQQLEQLLADEKRISPAEQRTTTLVEITQIILEERDAIRCKHPDVSQQALQQVEQYALSLKIRADAAEQHSRDLAEELALLRQLERTIHGIVERQPRYTDIPYNPISTLTYRGRAGECEDVADLTEDEEFDEEGAEL